MSGINISFVFSGEVFERTCLKFCFSDTLVSCWFVEGFLYLLLPKERLQLRSRRDREDGEFIFYNSMGKWINRTKDCLGLGLGTKKLRRGFSELCSCLEFYSGRIEGEKFC